MLWSERATDQHDQIEVPGVAPTDCHSMQPLDSKLTSVVQLECVELAARGLGAHISVHNLGAELIQGNCVVQWFAVGTNERMEVTH